MSIKVDRHEKFVNGKLQDTDYFFNINSTIHGEAKFWLTPEDMYDLEKAMKDVQSPKQ